MRSAPPPRNVMRTRNDPPLVPPQRRWFSDRRGAIATEYLVLVSVVGISLAGALIGLGSSLIADYERTRDTLILPVP